MWFTQVRRTGLGLLALVVLVGGAERATAQTTLRYKFKKGDKLNYVMEQKMNMSGKVAGMDNNVDFNSTFDMTWDVKDVDAKGKAKLAQTITRVRFTMKGGPANVEYDSKAGKEPEGPIGKVMTPFFKALVGAEIGLTMDAQGKISDVKVPEQVTKALKSAGPGLGDMFSQEGLKQMMDQSGLTLPAEAVTKGKTWDQKLEMKSFIGKMKVDTVYTYDGPAKRDGKELEKVSLKPKLAIEADENSPAKIGLKSQDAKGTAYFDNAAGRLVATEMTQNMEMQISVAGMELVQKMKQTVSMKLVK